MGELLYVKANVISGQPSRTFEIADTFIESYRNARPHDKVTVLDLYDSGIGFLTQEDVVAILNPVIYKDKNHRVFKYAYQFANADKVVIAAPLWNLSFPAILKAYFDSVAINGITFGYNDKGQIGLCKGKKVMYITTRGGVYSEGPMAGYDMGEKYINAIMMSFGITDVRTIVAEGLDIKGANVVGIVDEAKGKARRSAAEF